MLVADIPWDGQTTTCLAIQQVMNIWSFHFSAVMNKASTDILLQVCVGAGFHFFWILYEFARAAVTQNHKQKFIFHRSGGSKSKIEVGAGLVSSGTSLSSLQMVTSLPCPQKVFPLCVHRWYLSLCPNFLFLQGHQS